MSSHLEDLMETQLQGAGIPYWTPEYLFFPPRKWRFDFAWPEKMVALEVEGGTWSGSRHTTGKGFEQDCDKYNTAAILGWRLLRVTAKHIQCGAAIAWVTCILKHDPEVGVIAPKRKKENRACQ